VAPRARPARGQRIPFSKSSLRASYDFSNWIAHPRNEHCQRAGRVWLDFPDINHKHSLPITDESGNDIISFADSESNSNTCAHANSNRYSG